MTHSLGACLAQEWMDFFQEDEDLSEEELQVLEKLLKKMDTSGVSGKIQHALLRGDGQISPQEISNGLADPKLSMPEAGKTGKTGEISLESSL